MSLISIYLGGTLTILIGVFHIFFPKLLKWDKEFHKNSILNKKVSYTIHLALLLLFLAFGGFTIIFADQLSSAVGMALGLNIIFSLFWLWRAIWQVVYFTPNKIHYLLVVYFFLLAISYGLPIVL